MKHTLIKLMIAFVAVMALTGKPIEASPVSASQKRAMQTTLNHADANAIVVAGKNANNPTVLANHAQVKRVGKLRPTQLFPIASFQKSVTGLAIQQLINQHQLKLHQRLHRFFPKLPHSRQITVADLLTHKSGLVDVHQIAQRPIQTQKQNINFTEHNFRVVGRPGKWRYANINYGLLAMIVSKVSLANYQDYVREHIIEPNHIHGMVFFNQLKSARDLAPSAAPLGVGRRQNPWYYLQLEMSVEFGAGQLLGTPLSYWQFLQKAVLNDHHVVAKYRQASKQPATRHYYAGFYFQGKQIHANGAFRGYSCTVFANLRTHQAVMIFTNNLNLMKCRSLGNQLNQELMKGQH